MSVPYQIRPIDEWPGDLTLYRTRSPFASTLGTTHNELSLELDKLDAENVVLEIAISPLDIKIDGGLRAQKRPEHPGVILAFESKNGHLRFACDQYLDWADNLRAITKTLNALRAVERWGAVRDAEQYKGWATLHAPGANKMSARQFIDAHGGSFTEAAKRLHPDVGGDPALFQQLLEARKVLEGAV